MQDKDLFPTGPMELPGDDSQGPGGRYSRQKPRGSKKKIAIVVIVAAITGLATFIGWKFITKDSPASQDLAQSSNQQATTPAQGSINAKDATPITELKTFKADNPRVEFEYPSSWKATATEDQGILIESPEFNYTPVDGNEIAGNFRIYIRQGARPVDSSYIGSGKSIKLSETLTYTQAAPGQRSETNLIHFGYDMPDHFAYFFISGNFALQPGETLGPTYGQEPETYIIAGGYSSKDLNEELSMQRVPLNYYATTNAYLQALEILKSLKVL